ncbi:hypothetical protein HDZ31DRAFT_78371, partial [Schizophyllum fasciatum]
MSAINDALSTPTPEQTIVPSARRRDVDAKHRVPGPSHAVDASTALWAKAGKGNIGDDGPDATLGMRRRRRRRRRRRLLASDEPMREFRKRIDDYIENFMRTEGRDDADAEICPTCPAQAFGIPRYRCSECFGRALYCKECCIQQHIARPFCRIEEWRNGSFTQCSLQSLGLRVQLGHRVGERCPCPKTRNDFVVIHSNGLHKCTFDFCACLESLNAGDDCSQLLRRHLFPATSIEPRTCCTFEALRLFHMTTLQGKITAFDFYTALEKLTDILGIADWKSRYRCFLRTARQWRLIKAVMRSGRACDSTRRPSDFCAGELAVQCPACPRPGVNLPERWRDAPARDSFLYTLFIAVDACFRLKRRKISSRERDPGLMDGGAHMVESALFEKFLESVGTQSE